MASGPAVRGYMIFICLGSLVQMLQYCGRPEGTTGPDLIGRSTSNELVREVRLVLWAVLVLDPVAINTTQHTMQGTSIPDCKPESIGGRRRTNS